MQDFIFDNKDSALLTLLDDSDATLGPGLISRPDIINKINNTENRYLHISITELSESKIGSTDFLPTTLSLISQRNLALKLNNSSHFLSHFTVNRITLFKIRRLCSLVFLLRPSGIT
jgi:hypothetical protein